jgi:hypothetical protein
MDLSPRYLKVYRLSEPANRKQILEAAKAENPSRWSQNVRNSEPVGSGHVKPGKTSAAGRAIERSLKSGKGDNYLEKRREAVDNHGDLLVLPALRIRSF